MNPSSWFPEGELSIQLVGGPSPRSARRIPFTRMRSTRRLSLTTMRAGHAIPKRSPAHAAGSSCFLRVPGPSGHRCLHPPEQRKAIAPASRSPRHASGRLPHALDSSREFSTTRGPKGPEEILAAGFLRRLPRGRRGRRWGEPSGAAVAPKRRQRRHSGAKTSSRAPFPPSGGVGAPLYGEIPELSMSRIRLEAETR